MYALMNAQGKGKGLQEIQILGHISLVKILIPPTHTTTTTPGAGNISRCFQTPSAAPKISHSSRKYSLSRLQRHALHTGSHMAHPYPIYTLHKGNTTAAPRQHKDAGAREGGAGCIFPCMSRMLDNPSPPPPSLP